MASPTLSEPTHIVGEVPRVFRVGMRGPVAVTCWLGAIDAAAARALERVTTDVIARLPGQRFSTMHLADPRLRIPDAETRHVLVQLARASAAHIACAGVIMDDEGFWASALRGVITGVRVLAPRSLDIHAFASIEEVLDWLPSEHEKRTRVPVERAQLEHLLQEAKRWRDA